MIRENDPTSKTLLAHFAQHYKHDGAIDGLADLLLNIVFVRNTMSKEVVKMCSTGRLPWLTIDKDCCVSAASKEAIDGVFLQLGGKIFFQHVEPMKSRSKCPRRGYGEMASELVAFAKKARDLAALWLQTTSSRSRDFLKRRAVSPVSTGRSSRICAPDYHHARSEEEPLHRWFNCQRM